MNPRRPSAGLQEAKNKLEGGFDLVKVDSGQEKCHTCIYSRLPESALRWLNHYRYGKRK